MSNVMGVLFLFGAAVQYNDPDPWRWIAIWAAAALACFLSAAGRSVRALEAVVCLAAAIWSAALLPGVIGRVAPSELFEQFEMESIVIEQAREAFGLLIIALWMLVLIGAARRSAAPDAARDARARG
ncbi:MAG: transmembrane 220 family protein [Gemmatimonadetes bacterium]|nr:transmembrane 220 family protein [Gemmatimonadota bacterium]